MAKITFQDSENIVMMVPPGEYVVECVGYEFGLSRQGNETLSLTLRQEPDGAIVYDTLTFTQNAAWKIDTALKCLLPSKGIPKLPKGKEIDITEDFCAKYLLNARGRVDLIIEEYNGKEKNKVQSYLFLGEGQLALKPGNTPRRVRMEPSASQTEKAGSDFATSFIEDEDDDSIPF